MNKNRKNEIKNKPFGEESKDLMLAEKYSEAASLLYKHQKEEWSLLKKGVESLSSVKTHKFYFEGYEIYTQFNPQRINSTTADVSEEAVKNRKCFLCTENLPGEQQGIIHKGKYSVLCNPFPIFPFHLTIAAIEHIPQRIKNSFGDMLTLTNDFKEYSFIYNGPESGASAPDHLHFQAFKKDALPINIDYEGLKNEYGEEMTAGEVNVYSINDGTRRMIFFESSSIRSLEKAFIVIYDRYKNITKNLAEPMMNIITMYDDESGWKVMCFFRRKHRPDAYFQEGEGNILVSPASIDLGGVLITPLEKDFKKIDKNIIKEIFREVCIDKEGFGYLTTKLRE